MADHDTFNNEDAHANQHAYLPSVSLRDAFCLAFGRTFQKACP